MDVIKDLIVTEMASLIQYYIPLKGHKYNLIY